MKTVKECFVTEQVNMRTKITLKSNFDSKHFYLTVTDLFI